MPLSHPALADFLPAIARWFTEKFGEPSRPQEQGWPAIAAGGDVLIAAPTGSGKTLAAFLASIDSLLRQGLDGTLGDGTQVVYVSPLKALSNDVQKNLQAPLGEIGEVLREVGLAAPDIRVSVRTGDTTSTQRSTMELSYNQGEPFQFVPYLIEEVVNFKVTVNYDAPVTMTTAGLLGLNMNGMLIRRNQ